MAKSKAVLRKCTVCGVSLLIFVCVGSRPYQFNRLIEELDRLVVNGVIRESVFAQIGASTYEPKHFKFSHFMSSNEFKAKMTEADIVISHGASGSIMGALNAGKRVIAVSRLAEYGEHINNHQIAINESLAEEKLVLAVSDISNLGNAILKMTEDDVDLRSWKNENPTGIIDCIDDFIIKEIIK